MHLEQRDRSALSGARSSLAVLIEQTSSTNEPAERNGNDRPVRMPFRSRISVVLGARRNQSPRVSLAFDEGAGNRCNGGERRASLTLSRPI
jgi:hypothetical protein